MADYSKFLVKQYKYWGVYVHDNQSYLGRCIIWCDRKDAIQLADANQKEQDELFMIIKELMEASRNIFEAEWFNFSFLGNETHHLHGHFIPRYSSKKVFEGVTFVDKLCGHNYKTDKSFVTSSDVLEKIRLRMREYLV